MWQSDGNVPAVVSLFRVYSVKKCKKLLENLLQTIPYCARI